MVAQRIANKTTHMDTTSPPNADVKTPIRCIRHHRDRRFRLHQNATPREEEECDDLRQLANARLATRGVDGVHGACDRGATARGVALDQPMVHMRAGHDLGYVPMVVTADDDDAPPNGLSCNALDYDMRFGDGGLRATYKRDAHTHAAAEHAQHRPTRVRGAAYNVDADALMYEYTVYQSNDDEQEHAHYACVGTRCRQRVPSENPRLFLPADDKTRMRRARGQRTVPPIAEATRSRSRHGCSTHEGHQVPGYKIERSAQGEPLGHTTYSLVV